MVQTEMLLEAGHTNRSFWLSGCPLFSGDSNNGIKKAYETMGIKQEKLLYPDNDN